MKNEETAFFCKDNDIELLVVFGSSASGKTHLSSDVDLAIKFAAGKGIPKLELIYKLGGLFPDKEVDSVILSRDTDPLLLYEIFFRGTPLFEKEAGIFEKEKLRAWKLYIDTEHLREMQKKYIKKFAEKLSNVS